MLSEPTLFWFWLSVHALLGPTATSSRRIASLAGAGSRVRTRDPLITNQVLYQLSYTGAASA